MTQEHPITPMSDFHPAPFDDFSTELRDPWPVVERLQPGDIWRHKGMGTLYVTSEDMDAHPGYLKCYWRMSGTAGLRTFMDPAKTENLTLVERWGEQNEHGEWFLKPS